MDTKVCVVSGAANGIGKATLLRFASDGYSCIGIDKDADAIERTMTELSDYEHGPVELVHADLMEDDVGIAAVDALPASGLELTLINNVGGSLSRTPFESTSWERFVEVLEFNLKPLHTLTRACLPAMKRNRYGRIVNVASVSARKALPQVGVEYAAAKAAVVAVTRHLAYELAEAGILVNSLCPGIIATDRMNRRWASRSDEINQTVLASIPLRRLGQPAEVAEAISFLARSSYSAGCILDVNGGTFMP